MGRHSEYPKVAGIYKLTQVDSGKVYVGKSVNINRRLMSHKNCGKKVSGVCYFQNAIIKHGWDSFKVEILETVENFDKLKDNSSLLERESYYIKLFDSTDKAKGYNICKYSTDLTGIPFSNEHKEKLRISAMGNLNRLGTTQSSKTKEKIKMSRKGQNNRSGTVHLEDSKEKIRFSRIGRKHSDETKMKMSQTRLQKSNSNK